MNTIEQVKKALIAMTKSEKRVASFFLTQPSSFLYCTLDEIAETIGVSTTSVLRFCRKLDFDGFRTFQSQVREENHHFPSLTDKYNRTAQNSEDALLEKSLGNTLSCIEKTFRELNHDTLKFTISSLLGARKVFTFGMKESFALAHYAFTRLQTVRTEVYLLENIHQGQIETLLNMGPNDVCLFFLFPRYTKKSLTVLEIMKARGVKIFLVTDPEWTEKSQNLFPLYCYVDAGGIKNSAAAPVFLLDHLCNSLAAEGGESTLTHMKDTELLFIKGDVLE